MGSKFVDISEQDFVEFLENQYEYKVINFPGTLETVFCIDPNIDNVRVLVYSTLVGSSNRKVGKDAIRVILQAQCEDKWRVVWKSKRVHRTKNWRDNLEERIDTAFSLISDNTCEYCGSPLYQYTTKSGNKFWGCINWPILKCGQNTRTDSRAERSAGSTPVLSDSKKEEERKNNGVHHRERTERANDNGLVRSTGESELNEPVAKSSRSRAGAFVSEQQQSSRRNRSRNRVENNQPRNIQLKKKYPAIKLNPNQKEAVEFDKGTVIVSAGPGSGKTRVVTERIIHLIKKGVDPTSILATTFTAKAAEEMNTRLKDSGINTTKMSVQTMHSFCWKIIRASNKFPIPGWAIDNKEIYSYIIKDVVGYKSMKWKRCDITLVETFISGCKSELLRPEESNKWESFNKAPYFADTRYVQAYYEAEQERILRRLITFDDMLVEAADILSTDESIRNRVQTKYEYVIVDEFQDTNHAQMILTELIAAHQWNLMVVGDTDQCIYAFRGAHPEYMVSFQAKYNAHLIDMGINYRSSPEIITHASNCIVHNETRIPKNLEAKKTDKAWIKTRYAYDLDEEANIVADTIQELLVEGLDYNDFFILYRVNAQSRAIEEVFSKRKIPHVILGGHSFYQRKEIQDLLAYLKLMVDSTNDIAGARALTRPFRFVSKGLIEEIKDRANEFGGFLNSVNEIGCIRKANSGCIKFYELIVQLHREWNEWRQYDPATTVGKLLSHIVSCTHFLEFLESNEGSDTMENSRVANIGELVRSADRYTSIEDFLDYVDWQITEFKRRNKDTKNSVTCMTIHKSKGLESPVVFLIGVNEGILPHALADGAKEEERRLFYVATTRAKKYLHLSYVSQLGQTTASLEPSRFLEEGVFELDENNNDDRIDENEGDPNASS